MVPFRGDTELKTTLEFPQFFSRGNCILLVDVAIMTIHPECLSHWTRPKKWYRNCSATSADPVRAFQEHNICYVWKTFCQAIGCRVTSGYERWWLMLFIDCAKTTFQQKNWIPVHEINVNLIKNQPSSFVLRALRVNRSESSKLHSGNLQKMQAVNMRDAACVEDVGGRRTSRNAWELICTQGWFHVTFANHVSQPFAGVASGIKVVRLCPSTLSVEQAEVSGTGCTFVATLELRNNFRNRSLPVLEPVGAVVSGVGGSRHTFVRWFTPLETGRVPNSESL